MTMPSTSRIRAWALPALAAAVAVAVAAALILARYGPAASALPAQRGPGTLITLRVQGSSLSKAQLRTARQVIGARAAALGAPDADVRIVGRDELAAFLPGVPASKVGALGAVDDYQVRPFVIDWTLAPSWPMSVPVIPDPPVIDQWKSLGFAAPKDSTAYRALDQAQQDAVRAVISNWNCSDRPLDRPDQPIVVCDKLANKYLLGPAIVSGQDVRSSAVEQLSPEMRQRHSAVTVVLSASGHRQWQAYAALHNDAVHPFDKANLVASMLDYTVALVYGTNATSNGDSSIMSDDSAQQVDATLAANLTGGPLPAPFDIVSVRSN